MTTQNIKTLLDNLAKLAEEAYAAGNRDMLAKIQVEVDKLEKIIAATS